VKRLGIIVAVGAAIRAVFVLLAARIPEGVHDPVRYLLHGLDLAAGDGYRSPEDGSPTAYYPVGYPLFLSFLFRAVALFHDPSATPVPDLFAAARDGTLSAHADVVGPFVWTALVCNVLLSVGTIVLVHHIARKLGGEIAGLVAAAIVACFPNLVFHTGALLTETLFLFLSLAALAVIVDGGDRVAKATPPARITPSRWIVGGALLGCAALVRPIVLALLPCVPLALLAGRIRLRNTASATALLVLACFAVLLPWSARNQVAMDAPILVSTNMGDNLCIGHHEGAPGHFVVPTPCETPDATSLRSGPRAEVARNADRRRQALAWAVANPEAELELLGRKLYFLLWHDHNGLTAVESYGNDRFLPDPVRAFLERTADLYFFATLALGTLGIGVLLWPPWSAPRLLLAAAIFAFATGPLLFFGHPRFHVPLSPLLAIAGALLSSKLVPARWRGRAKPA